LGRSDITLGAVFAVGSSETTLGVPIGSDQSGQVAASLFRATFIFGFNFSFLEI